MNPYPSASAFDVQPGEPPSGPPYLGGVAGLGAGLLSLLIVLVLVTSGVSAAAGRLKNPGHAAQKPAVALADHAEVAYCTPQFKQVLQRVLHSCGLSDKTGRRGCQPTDVRTFANITDTDFNALFTPLKDRGGVIMFDVSGKDLDDGARQLLREKWEARRGARYFFIVARASQTGTSAKNRALSHERANSVMFFLQELTRDPDLDKKVGMLWLGEEYAQLSTEYCSWSTSRPGQKCNEDAINRTAFISWVDCRL